MLGTMDGREDGEKVVAPFNTNDYWAGIIMHHYRHLNTVSMFVVKMRAMAAGPPVILLFDLLESSAASTLMAFVAIIILLMFVGIRCTCSARSSTRKLVLAV